MVDKKQIREAFKVNIRLRFSALWTAIMFCYIYRVPVQQLLLKWKQNPNGKSWEDFEKELHGWYAKDKAQTIQHEFSTLLQNLF